MRGAKKPRAGVGVFTGSFLCDVSVFDNDEKRKKEEMRQYVHVVSMRAFGNSDNVGVDRADFFLPDPSRRPPQLGFRGLDL